jgi:hypothetical protein
MRTKLEAGRTLGGVEASDLVTLASAAPNLNGTITNNFFASVNAALSSGNTRVIRIFGLKVCAFNTARICRVSTQKSNGQTRNPRLSIELFVKKLDYAIYRNI